MLTFRFNNVLFGSTRFILTKSHVYWIPKLSLISQSVRNLKPFKKFLLKLAAKWSQKSQNEKLKFGCSLIFRLNFCFFDKYFVISSIFDFVPGMNRRILYENCRFFGFFGVFYKKLSRIMPNQQLPGKIGQ